MPVIQVIGTMWVTRSALTQLIRRCPRLPPETVWLLKGSEVRLLRRFEPPPGPSQRRAEQMEPFPSKALHVS